ncbi:MAG: type II toxin-antitoxin system PemK/MazF family toxin [archaeon]
MEEIVKSDIVVLPFLFTDLSATKKRPALIIAALRGEDCIVCQITGKIVKYTYVVELNDTNIIGGKLDGVSYVRTNKIFTADKSIIQYKIGKLDFEKMNAVEEKIIGLIRNI